MSTITELDLLSYTLVPVNTPNIERDVCPCFDCGIDTRAVGDHFMLVDHVGASAIAGDPVANLCIGCAESRLGRRLRGGHFNDFPVHTWPSFRNQISRGLLLRLSEVPL